MSEPIDPAVLFLCEPGTEIWVPWNYWPGRWLKYKLSFRRLGNCPLYRPYCDGIGGAFLVGTNGTPTYHKVAFGQPYELSPFGETDERAE